MRSVKIYFKHFKESLLLLWTASPWIFALRVFIEIVTIFLPILSSYLSKLLIDFLGSHQGISTEKNKLIWLICLFVIMTLVNMAIRKISALLSNDHSDLIGNRLSLRMIKKINELDISYFDDPKMYDEIQNSKRDSNALSGFSWIFISIAKGVISLITTSIILGSLSIYLPFFVALFNLPSVFVDRYMVKFQHNWERSKTKNERKIGYLRGILEHNRYAKDVRIFGSYSYILDRYQSLWKEWYKDKRKVNRKKALASFAVAIIPYVPIIYVFFYVSIHVIQGKFTVGDYTFYTSLVNQFQAGLLGVIASINQMHESNLRLSKFEEFLSWPSKIQDNGIRTIERIDSIEFKNVCFKYPHSNKMTLCNLSFKTESNEKVALVGVNGAGKTTIVKLLLRLYEPCYGEILINGNNIQEYRIESLRKSMGVVFQDFNRYAMKLRDAVAMSDLSNCDNNERIDEALNAADFCLDERFADGKDTCLGKIFDENGVELSGGQWQKIAIAQSYFKDSKYMILDEPSASLDSIAEHFLFSRMNDLCKNRGALFITHRLSCVSSADRIIMIENGKCIGSGTHELLMQTIPAYAELYNLQASKYSQSFNS